MYSYLREKQLVFSLFQAKHDIKECMEFQLNHVSKLEKYSIKVSSTGLNWIFSDGVYGITAKNMYGKLIGGIRLHIKSNKQKLPFEDAVKCEIFNHYSASESSAEMCALWTSGKLDNLNLPFCLVNCAAILCKDLGIQKVYSFPWHKTQNLVKKIGFKIDPKLGKEEGIPYPNNQYRSFIMSADLGELKHIHSKETDQFNSQLKMGRFKFKKEKIHSSLPIGIPTVSIPTNV